jgi:hypothetical protein
MDMTILVISSDCALLFVLGGVVGLRRTAEYITTFCLAQCTETPDLHCLIQYLSSIKPMASTVQHCLHEHFPMVSSKRVYSPFPE